MDGGGGGGRATRSSKRQKTVAQAPPPGDMLKLVTSAGVWWLPIGTIVTFDHPQLTGWGKTKEGNLGVDEATRGRWAQPRC